MTYTKLPGISYTETVATTPVAAEEGNIPLFIIDHPTDTINGFDDTICHFDNYDAFATLTADNGLTVTKTYIQDTLMEYGATEFYTYSIESSTAAGYTKVIEDTAHLDDVKNMIYIEEKASTGNGNLLPAKVTAIINGLHNIADGGVFRKCFVIPYGSVSNANGIAGKKTSLNSITTGDGRLCIILPDENAGIIAGKCLATVYNEDPGKNPVNSVIHESSLQLNASDMLDLLNSGVLLLRREKVMGGEVYRILLGVTTNCKTDKADKLIMSRNIVDELLTRIGREGQPFVKDKETQNNEVMLQSVVDAIVDEFARNDDIYREGTSLTVGGDGEKFTLNGIIKPVHSAYGIEVNTTIQ